MEISERANDIYVASGLLALLQLFLFLAAGVSVVLLLRRMVNNGLANESLANLVSQLVTVAGGVAFFCVLRALVERHELAFAAPWTAATSAPSAPIRSDHQVPFPWNPPPTGP